MANMKGSFYIKIDPMSLVVLDACDYYGRGMIITRINVPKAHRGKGYGTKVLKKCLKEADRKRVRLFLEVSASDGLNRDQLTEWYKRHGFINYKGIYMRRPDGAKVAVT